MVNEQLMMDSIGALESVISVVRLGIGSMSSGQVVGVRQHVILFLTISRQQEKIHQV